MQAKVLGLNDIEDLNYLAEEVLMQLRFEGYRYDENGDEKAFAKSENGSHKERTKEMIEWIEMLEHNHPLSFRGNEELMKIPFTYALEISFDEIKEKYLKDYLPMMRGIMRKDTMLIGYIAGEEISDDLIIYSYEKEKDGMRFVTVTPEQVWGEKTAKELRGKQI